MLATTNLQAEPEDQLPFVRAATFVALKAPQLRDDVTYEFVSDGDDRQDEIDEHFVYHSDSLTSPEIEGEAIVVTLISDSPVAGPLGLMIEFTGQQSNPPPIYIVPQ